MEDKVHAVRGPTPSEAARTVTKGVKLSQTVEVVGRCRVRYDGRAASRLGPGDRVVLVKSDGTLLVHQRENRKPVNWQPSGSRIRASVEDGSLRIASESDAPREVLTVDFDEVYCLHRMNLQDNEALSLAGQEDQMRDRLAANPELVAEDFRVVETERETDYGRIDIFGRDGDGNVVLVELKRKQIGPSAVDQLYRYVQNYEERGYEDVRGVLAAPDISDNAEARVEDNGFEFVELEPETTVEEKTAKLTEF